MTFQSRNVADSGSTTTLPVSLCPLFDVMQSFLFTFIKHLFCESIFLSFLSLHSFLLYKMFLNTLNFKSHCIFRSFIFIWNDSFLFSNLCHLNIYFSTSAGFFRLSLTYQCISVCTIFVLLIFIEHHRKVYVSVRSSFYTFVLLSFCYFLTYLPVKPCL